MTVRKRNLAFVLIVTALVLFQAVGTMLAAPPAQGGGNDTKNGQRHVGTVSWFSVQRGYGYIAEDGSSYRVHYSDIQGEGFPTLEAGQKVEFSVSNSRLGPQANNVVVLGEDNNQDHIGTVSWFSVRRGYGYIAEGGKTYRVHYSDIQSEGLRTLESGQQVKFSVKNSRLGPQATNVVVLGS